MPTYSPTGKALDLVTRSNRFGDRIDGEWLADRLSSFDCVEYEESDRRANWTKWTSTQWTIVWLGKHSAVLQWNYAVMIAAEKLASIRKNVADLVRPID